MTYMKTGKTFIISGPSGVGKSTVLRALLRDRDDLYFSDLRHNARRRVRERWTACTITSSTSSPFREMDRRRTNSWSMPSMWATFTARPRRYVDEAMAQGKDVILDIEVQGAMQVMRQAARYRAHLHRPSHRGTELEQPPDRTRGPTAPRRSRSALLRAKVELQTADTYDYFVINDTVENAVREINAIMLAEHCRPSERMEILRVRYLI